MKFQLDAKVKLRVIEKAVRAASERINQYVFDERRIPADECRRIIWEEIDKRLEAKP